MSEHRVTVHWMRDGAEFTPKAYSRDHVWKFEGGSEVRASAAPQYLGNPALVDPEGAFVAALSSCHMLTFLALAARDRLVVDRYEVEAVGFLERDADKKMAITRVVLRPRIMWGSEPPSKGKIDSLHHDAHKHCFIASSVKTTVEVASPA